MQLIDLGETIEPTEEQEELAKKIAKKFGFELDNED
jgi:glutathione synthase/RimK-type ligase-like ATP-grasp enzyme